MRPNLPRLFILNSLPPLLSAFGYLLFAKKIGLAPLADMYFTISGPTAMLLGVSLSLIHTIIHRLGTPGTSPYSHLRTMALRLYGICFLLCLLFGALSWVYFRNHLVNCQSGPMFRLMTWTVASSWFTAMSIGISSVNISIQQFYARFQKAAILNMIPQVCTFTGLTLVGLGHPFSYFLIIFSTGCFIQLALSFTDRSVRGVLKASSEATDLSTTMLDTLLFASSILPFTVLPLFDSLWAPKMPSGLISSMSYCTRIGLAFSAIAIGTLVPIATHSFLKHEGEERKQQSASLSGLFFVLTACIAALLLSARRPAFDIIFHDPVSIARLSKASCFYFLALPFMASTVWKQKESHFAHRAGSFTLAFLPAVAFYALLPLFFEHDRYNWLFPALYLGYWALGFSLTHAGQLFATLSSVITNLRNRNILLLLTICLFIPWLIPTFLSRPLFQLVCIAMLTIPLLLKIVNEVKGFDFKTPPPPTHASTLEQTL